MELCGTAICIICKVWKDICTCQMSRFYIPFGQTQWQIWSLHHFHVKHSKKGLINLYFTILHPQFCVWFYAFDNLSGVHQNIPRLTGPPPVLARKTKQDGRLNIQIKANLNKRAGMKMTRMMSSVAMVWLGPVMTDFGWLSQIEKSSCHWSQVTGANGDLKRSNYDLNHDLRLI